MANHCVLFLLKRVCSNASSTLVTRRFLRMPMSSRASLCWKNQCHCWSNTDRPNGKYKCLIFHERIWARQLGTKGGWPATSRNIVIVYLIVVLVALPGTWKSQQWMICCRKFVVWVCL